jgi:outer membrane protein insertion porin family
MPTNSPRQYFSALLIGTMMAGVPSLVFAQGARPTLMTPAAPAPAPETDGGTIKSIAVSGSQRIEGETVRSYVKLRAGAPYTRETLDEALEDLFATELFADVQIRDEQGALTIIVKENPVINRIVFEGNKRVKEDKLGKELKLAPRTIFTRSKVRADIARIIELYRRQGRFAATVEPKMVMLDQNRVDIVYEISEGRNRRSARSTSSATKCLVMGGCAAKWSPSGRDFIASFRRTIAMIRIGLLMIRANCGSFI